MHTLTRTLTWCGALPFFIALIFSVSNTPLGSLAAETVFIGYSVVILCFMAGALWGNTHHLASAQRHKILLASNIWALVAWAVLLICAYQPGWSAAGIALLGLGYWHVYWLEATLLQDTSRDDYLSLRKRITSAVIVTHLLMLIVASR